MVRVALFTYLIASAALGPAFCCCRLSQIFPKMCASPCCGKPATSLVESHRHSNCQCRHDDDQTGHHPATGTAKEPQGENKKPSSLPCDSKCPCGKHDPGILLVSGWSPNSIAAASFIFANWTPGLLSTLVPGEFFGKSTHRDKEQPALLSGREMLRAYQTMRC
jgi:hypothetical protein